MSATALAVSTVLKGVTFENRSLRVLREHLSMALRRVGGKGDGGIDLQGWWWLPAECLGFAGLAGSQTSNATTSQRMAVRVLAQCKAEEKKIGPRFIREFEGTVLRNSLYLTATEGNAVPHHDVRNAAVGLFASTSPFTKASILQAYSSPIPLALMHLPDSPPRSVPSLARDQQRDSDQNAPPGSLLFNPALSGANGLLRGTLEPRWERSAQGSEGRPGLWSNGRRLESWVPESGEDDSSTVPTTTSVSSS
ncbi:hypothetical protein C8Q76DRAFT_797620 [Earliella scabrosa]|nr:hypothetical protein C8Q76DRAFT_797620 [Earliella scabrosa]